MVVVVEGVVVVVSVIVVVVAVVVVVPLLLAELLVSMLMHLEMRVWVLTLSSSELATPRFRPV